MAYNNSYQGGNRGNMGRGYGAPQPHLPDGYLTQGYYEIKNDKKFLRSEYIVDFPERIAKDLEDRSKNKSSQIRKFYDYCVRLDGTMKRKSFNEVEADFKRLIPFVKYACTRNRVSQLFVDFIERNVLKVKDKHDFRAFLKHFEALIAYLPKDNN